MEERYKSKIVVDLLLKRINKETEKMEVLLLLRQNTGYGDGLYDIPGGHVEKNEDIFDAMIREAKEEIGIDILKENMRIIHIYHHYKKDVLKFVFDVTKYKKDVINKETNKCKELKWIEIDKIPDNTIPSIKKEIENIKNNVYYNCDNI